MTQVFNISRDQLNIKSQLINHFYPGIFIILFYIIASPSIIALGYPGIASLLAAEVLILMPIGLSHLYVKGNQLNNQFSLKNVIAYVKPISGKQFLKWTIIGILLCLVVYIPLYPVGLALRENVFTWLPEWYFNPGFGTDNVQLLANVFLVGILIDGIIGPVVEELYFRGYLLPRMEYLGKWAPVLNGLLFGLYHFWQPHNYAAIIAIGIVLSYIVWKKKNVYLGIAIHCTINILGSVMGYFAASSGEFVAR